MCLSDFIISFLCGITSVFLKEKIRFFTIKPVLHGVHFYYFFVAPTPLELQADVVSLVNIESA